MARSEVPLVRGTPSERLKAFLRALALADLYGRDSPGEGWYASISLLESWGAGRFDLGSAALDMHRLFFPMLGEARSAATRSAMKKGTFVPPPVMHPYFATALEYVVVNDHEGPMRAKARFRVTDNAIGLSRCALAGAANGGEGGAYGLGAGLAALTHCDSTAKALGGYLAVVAHHFFRGADLRGAFDRANLFASRNPPGAAVVLISESAKMAEHNGLAFNKDTEYVPCREVARIFGRYALGKASAGLMATGALTSRTIMPIVRPFVANGPVEIPGSLTRRISAAVDAAVATGVIIG